MPFLPTNTVKSCSSMDLSRRSSIVSTGALLASMGVEGSHPLDAGFDGYYGIKCNYAKKVFKFDPLYRGKSVDREHVKYEELTSLYSDKVVESLSRESSEPFFIVLRRLSEAERIRKELGDVDVLGSDQRAHGLIDAQERGN